MAPGLSLDLIRAAIGGGRKGVSLHMLHLQRVLKRAMLLTGCRDLASISPEILVQSGTREESRHQG